MTIDESEARMVSEFLKKPLKDYKKFKEEKDD